MHAPQPQIPNGPMPRCSGSKPASYVRTRLWRRKSRKDRGDGSDAPRENLVVSPSPSGGCESRRPFRSVRPRSCTGSSFMSALPRATAPPWDARVLRARMKRARPRLNAIATSEGRGGIRPHATGVGGREELANGQDVSGLRQIHACGRGHALAARMNYIWPDSGSPSVSLTLRGLASLIS